ncbi:hypothetical protein Kpho01_75200 [Kitasatospora phosalacinea]|uniref:Uncharacterized protein n=1 Tax=Kitasatospora phosalacinea TaxID=2065 RepID=A0A9W6PNH6_9ACTN|nr:hypothetical protein Kpho01_75200 [Kitasatospora phosalacinea]
MEEEDFEMDESRAPRGLEGGPGESGRGGVERRSAGRGRRAGWRWEAWRSPGRMRGQMAAAVVGGLSRSAACSRDSHSHVQCRSTEVEPGPQLAIKAKRLFSV